MASSTGWQRNGTWLLLQKGNWIQHYTSTPIVKDNPLFKELQGRYPSVWSSMAHNLFLDSTTTHDGSGQPSNLFSPFFKHHAHSQNRNVLLYENARSTLPIFSYKYYCSSTAWKERHCIFHGCIYQIKLLCILKQIKRSISLSKNSKIMVVKIPWMNLVHTILDAPILGHGFSHFFILNVIISECYIPDMHVWGMRKLLNKNNIRQRMKHRDGNL